MNKIDAVLADAGAIHWEQLRGAYGLSDASDHSRDVLRGLACLAHENDTDSGAWGDAYDDLLQSHLWHQYTIYEVTPIALPFLIRIASQRAAHPAGLAIADAIALIAEAAKWSLRSSDANQVRLGTSVVDALIAQAPELRTWLGGALAPAMERIRLNVPASIR